MHKHPILKLFKILIIILALATCIIAVHNHLITRQEKITSQNYIQNTQNLNKAKKHYTVNKVRTQLSNQAPNINNAQVNSNKRLKTGLSLAFNGDMNKRSEIQSTLGKLSNRVLQITHNKGTATKVKNINIGYGEYNMETKAMPIHIIVKYMAGKNQKYASYILIYNPQASYNNQYSLLSYSGDSYN